MKPAPFDLHVPTTAADAAALLTEYGDEAKVLAGGQSLVPMLALRLTRFEHLVDLNRIAELTGIERTNGHLTVGAMTRQAAVEHSTVVAAAVPLLAHAVPHIGHFQIRNRGTIGGSLAHADPASELPAVAVALDAELELLSVRGRRTVKATDFFVSTWTTAGAADELLTSVRFPIWEGRCGFAVEEVARRHGDFALVGVVCAVALGPGGAVARSAIGLFGLGSTPIRARQAEAAVAHADPGHLDLKAVARAAIADAAPGDDLHASARYRRSVGAHLVERALTRALEEASHA